MRLGACPKSRPDSSGVDVLAPIESGDAMIEFRLEIGELSCPDALVLLEEAEGLANDLAGRGVAPGLHFLGDKCFQLPSERYVHGILPSDLGVSLKPDGRLCQSLSSPGLWYIMRHRPHSLYFPKTAMYSGGVILTPHPKGRVTMPTRRVLVFALLLALGWATGAGQAPRMILTLGSTSWLNSGDIQAATGALVKKDLEQYTLKDFRVVVLGNIAFGSLPGVVQQGLVDYVGGGGTLLITGGSQSFGSGGYQAVPPIIPFEVRAENDWRAIPFRPPIVLQPGHPIMAGVTFITVGAVNDMNPRGGALEIMQAAGGGSAAGRVTGRGGGSFQYPLIAEVGVGTGRVIGVAMDLNDFPGMPDLPLFVRNTMVYLASVSQAGQ